ncbi:hypothetical protein COLO4_32203 [Corchorus olitorius]|uniref:Uncharacterized protein n=1 Tax=Corchorus olitorius TaxID=93759 RepID=A0A1R3H0I0_9ROSI|nr:hypothetical protein COLO4_32203 [Corchorus olitorius]
MKEELKTDKREQMAETTNPAEKRRAKSEKRD